MKGSQRILSVSVDLDSVACYRDIHGLVEVAPLPDPAYTVGVSRLLNLFAELEITSTLFVIGRDTADPEHRATLRAAAKEGHELASHSWSHNYALRTLGDRYIFDDMSRVHDALTTLQDREPTGFRAPGYNIDDRLLESCIELGYTYDSSVFPCPLYYAAKGLIMAGQFAVGRPSRSALTRAEALLAPTTPYRPRVGGTRPTFWKRGDAPILEIPIAVIPGVRFPLIGTSLHILGRSGFDAAYPLIKRAHHLLNLEFHTIDFMDAEDPGMKALVKYQPDLNVSWEAKRTLYKHIFSTVARDYQFRTLRDAAEAWNE